MFKIFLGIIFLLSGFSLFAQTASEKPVMISLVTKDSVYVKVVPSNFEMFKAFLTKGATFTYAFGQKGDFSGSVENKVKPVEERWSFWDVNNKEIDKVKTLLEGVVSAQSIDTVAKNYAFALASIEASVSFKMNELSGIMIGLKKTSSDYLNVKVSIPGYGVQEINVEQKKVTKNNSLPALSGAIDKKKIVTIKWDAKTANKDYLGFIVERKVDNGKFESQMEEPYVHLVTSTEMKNKLAEFRDEKVEQGKKYTYRVTGINYFGKLGEISNEVEILVPRLTNATVAIDTIYADKFNRVLKVHLSPETRTLPMQVSLLQVQRSKELLTGYSTVFEQKVTSKDSLFTVKVPSELETGDSYYYKVLAFSVDKDTAYSPPKYFFTLDQQPPKAITNLTGKIDSLGVVSLSWEQSTDNDLFGFRVFRANAKNEEFVERNSEFITGKTFTDILSLNTLTNKIYYFVIAVDENFNNSPNSDTILILKPDTIPPTPPVLVDVIGRDAKVKLAWENSSSEDLAYQALYRVCEGKVDTLLTGELLNKGSFLDTNAVFGKDISYRLVVRDEGGNSAYSVLRTIHLEPGFRKALENVNAVADRKAKVITVTWNAPTEQVFQYFIYRKKNDGKFELVKTLEASKAKNYMDNNLTVSSKYEYYVQYQTVDGIRSLKHKPVQVKY